MENKGETIKKLMELKQLYEAGVLTKEELEIQKAELLNQQDETESPEEVLSKDTNEHIKQDNKKDKKLLYIITTIAVVAIGVVLFFYFNSGDFSTKKVQYEYKTADFEIAINIDYPNGGNTQLVQSLQKFIINVLNEKNPDRPQYKGDLSDGQAVVDFYGQDWANYMPTVWDDLLPATEALTISYIFENQALVSYEVLDLSECMGMGGESTHGNTFKKSDGQELEFFDLLTLQDPAFREIINNAAETALRNQLGKGPNDAECPLFEMENRPYVSENGIRFIYRFAEYCDYVVTIKFDIPITTLYPYLTDEAKELLGGI